MEPLKPDTVRNLINRPQVAPADVEEYERLLSERFTMDPSIQASPQQQAVIQAREARIQQLYHKLFVNQGVVI
jgi:hypothetical protein